MDEGYIEDGLEVDAGTLYQEILDGLQSRLGGNWAAENAHVETALAGVIAPMVADNREVASLMLRSAVNYLAEDVFSIPIVEATPATGSATVTALDDVGYLLEAGSQFSIRDDAGVTYGFEVRDNVTIAAGTTTTTAGEVTLDAVIAGAGGSGLTGPVTAVTSLQWLESVELVGQTTSGVDAEDRDAYLSRASELFTLHKVSVVLAADAAKFVRLTIPQVGRAVGLDGYNPADATFNNERMIAVAIAGTDGEALPTSVKNEADAALQANREASFVANVIDPTHTAISVTTTAVSYLGVDLATVEQAVEDALVAYLSPANWGAGMTWGDLLTGVPWSNEGTVRVDELKEQVNRVQGVHYVQSLTVNGGASDVVLAGAAPLTRPGTITATLAAP